MELGKTVTRVAATVESALKTVLMFAGRIVGIGLVLLLFGVPTYQNAKAGDYGEAAIGVVILLAFGAGAAWWIYRRVGSGVELPSLPTPGN